MNFIEPLRCADGILVVNSSSSSILSSHGLGPDSTESGPRSGPPEVQMNWLSRFLHIKPATKTLCFHVGRGKVRGDLVRLLRDWQRFGVRDVTYDRTANTINARVDKTNRKSPSPARSLFSAWRLGGWCFQAEVLDLEFVSRYYRALFSCTPYFLERSQADSHVLQISISSRFHSSSSSSSFWSTGTEPTFAWPDLLRPVAQHPASARLSILLKMCAAQSLCWLRIKGSKQR